MEQPGNNLENNEKERIRKDSDFVLGFGTTPKEEVIKLAKTERVGNIRVGDDFTDKDLDNLRKAFAEYKDAGIFANKQEKEDYEGFIRTIERVLRARQRLQEEEDLKNKKPTLQ